MSLAKYCLICLFLMLSPINRVEAREISLSGSLAGGVEVCIVDSKECITTPDAEETSVEVLSYRDGEGEVVILLNGRKYVALPNQISISYKGCELTLSSFLLNKLCPGMKK